MSRTYHKKYSGAKAVDKQCRCHGECDYCRNNRLHQQKKENNKIKDMYLFYEEEKLEK